MKKSLMILIGAGIVVLALLISIIVAHGKISSTERKLSLCNDELNKVSEQLKELKEYTANETFIDPKNDDKNVNGNINGENEYGNGEDADAAYYNNYTRSTTYYSSTRSYDYDDDEDDDDDDYTTYRTTTSYRTSAPQTTRIITTASYDNEDDE